MSLLGRIFGRSNEGDDADPAAAAPDSVEEAANNGPETDRDGQSVYAPSAARTQLLARVRGEAEADAVRHAEDMFDRQFPIAAEAERIAERRLADLHAEYMARDAELRERCATRENEVEATARQLEAIRSALRGSGVPGDQVDAGSLRPRIEAWKVAAGLVIGGATGYLLTAAQPGLIEGAALLIGALGLLMLLLATSAGEIEERAVTALRKNHARVSEKLVRLGSDVARIEIDREALRGDTRAIAEGEIAFAGELAAAYVTAAFSAMPAGSLEGGQEFATQQEPHVEMPAWVFGLEAVG